MSHSAGSGDRLARGAVRASFTVRDEKTVSQEAWDRMFGDFDPEKYKNSETPVDPNAKKASEMGLIQDPE